LTGLKFDASEDGKLAITGTDLEIGVTCTVPAEVQEPGSVVIPAATVVSLFEKLTSDEVTVISKDGIALMIKYGKSEASLNGFSADEYPETPSIDTEFKFSVGGEKLCEVMSRVVYAVGDDITKPAMCGVNFEIKNGEINLAATDTHRLAISGLKVDGITYEKTVIIPKKAAEEIIKLLKSSKDVAVQIGENHVKFVSSGITMVSAVINGKFPNYKNILPKNFTAKVKVKPVDLINALERASVLAGANATVALHLNNNFVDIISKSERGQSRETIEAVVVDGAGMKIHFSAGYLIDGIKNTAVNNSEVWIGFTGPLSPAMIKAAAGGNSLGIVLPRRFAEKPVAEEQTEEKKVS
ncbi:MAG: DNA polymerase III subunit beta, partial [Firmicutes bacterium]|nr:DNA polymerase III subunit beta [Bacillota bacterium]